MAHQFYDKKVLVTGSSRGIGRAIAEYFLKCGAIVGIHGRNTSTLLATSKEISLQYGNCPLHIFPADFTMPQEAARIVNQFVEKTGDIDILVNNAGAGKAVAFRAVTLERWRTTSSVNLEATLEASRTAYSIMRKKNKGVIINIASIAAHGPGKWMGADYAAAKAAIVSITKTLAFESARYGIRVNAVSPGFIETAMTTTLPEATKQNLQIPMGRLGYPEEIASVVAFLASEDASYITGEVIKVDGGISIK